LPSSRAWLIQALDPSLTQLQRSFRKITAPRLGPSMRVNSEVTC